MNMARIAHSNRLPDSLPVVLAILESHVDGITIPAMQAEIESKGLWEGGSGLGPRANYFRIRNVLKLLKSKGIVHRVDKNDRDGLWHLDRAEYANQRRKELAEVIQPLVDGCLMVTDPRQFVGQLNEMIEDGTIDMLLAERRARGRRSP
jgi:hypothetical protein